MTQELREAAKKYKDLWLPDDHYDAFIAGATWQAKRMYTEEQVKEAIRIARLPMDHDETTNIYSRPSVDGIIQSLKQK